MKRILVTVFCIIAAVVFTTEGNSQAPGSVPISLVSFNKYLNAPEAVVHPAAFLENVNLDQDAYVETAVNKVSTGAINVVTSWTEIPVEVAKTAENSNILDGLSMGLVRGVFMGVARAISGSSDIVTGGLPPYDKPLMKPEFLPDNPDRDGLKIKLMEW